MSVLDDLELAERRKTIDLLDARYQRDGRLAGAREAATRYVGGMGSLSPVVVLVGEAPGAEEDEAGEPFVGRSGRLLDELLERHGVSRREACWTTNLVRYRPLRNADPDRRHTQASLPYLRAEVAALHPPVVATLGRIATAAIWPEMTPITRCHGVERLLWADQLHLPMLHPSYALRGTTNLALFEQDVSALVSLIKELTE